MAELRLELLKEEAKRTSMNPFLWGMRGLTMSPLERFSAKQ